MVRSDPYTPETKRFECPTCGFRGSAASDACPECDGELRNIAVSRE